MLKNQTSRPRREKKVTQSVEACKEKKRKSRKLKSFYCSLCPRKKHFSSKKVYESHILEHDEKTEELVFMCEICSAVLRSEAYLKRHIETRHSKVQKIYSCDSCGKTFSHKDYLRIHIDRHRVHQILTCTVCQKSYSSKHTFRRHLKMHVEKHICTVCGLIFHQKLLFDNHYATKHSDDLPFKCLFCTRLFASKTARNNHHYIAHRKSKTELNFKCYKCNIYFEMKEELRIHSFIHFNGEIKTCLECNQIFKTTRLLNIHMQKHEPKKLFQCTQCCEFFTFKTGLAKHLRLGRCRGPLISGEGEECTFGDQEVAEIALRQLNEMSRSKLKVKEPESEEEKDTKYELSVDSVGSFKFSDTEEIFEEKLPKVETKEIVKVVVEEKLPNVEVETKETRKFRFSKKLKSVDLPKGRPHLVYTCDFCGKSIKFKKDFLLHVKQHTINQRYKCKECDESFKSKKKLIDHSSEVHGIKLLVLIEAFSCETCGKMFDARSALEAHKRSHDESTRKHVCEVCSAAFKSIGNLRRHAAIHVTSRNFHCDLCHKSFKTELALKLHFESVHAEMRVFVNCGICQAIVQEKHLTQHIKNMHTEEGQEKPFECNACGKKFRTEKLGQRHYEAVHEAKDRGVIYTCPHCPELLFYRQRELKEHSFVHFEGTIFQCDECLKMFKSKRLLMIHQASHIEVDYPCNLCENVVFKTPGGRRKHILRLHSKFETQEELDEEEN